MLFALELDLAAGIFSEQDLVAGFYFERNELAVFLVGLALPYRDNLAFLWFLLGSVGDDDATLGLFLFLDSPDQYAIAQWSNLHWGPAASLPCFFDPLFGLFWEHPAGRNLTITRQMSIGTRERRVPTPNPTVLPL